MKGGKLAVPLEISIRSRDIEKASAAIRSCALQADGTQEDLDTELEAVAVEDLAQELS